MTSKNTKRALISSALAIVVCVAMLIGTTFAWFTDTASTGVNKIQAGNLDIALEMKDASGEWVNAEGTTLQFKTADNRTENILWEPGCTYELPELRVVNNGNLAVKFYLSVNGVDGNAKLLEAIEWTMSAYDGMLTFPDLDSEVIKLLPGNSWEFKLSAHMKEEAGNEYQNEALEGVGITVVATQDTVEYDSFDNQYDKDAEYPVAVSTERELLNALQNGENVVLEDDVYVQYGVSVPAGKDVTIDLNGKTVTAKKNFVTVQAGGKLTVSGGTVSAGNYVFNVDGGEVVVNSGDYTAQECVFAVKTAGKLTINGGTFTAKDNSVISTSGNIENAGSEITVNGGTFNANIQTSGYIACAVYVANKDTVKLNAGTFNVKNGIGVMMRAGNTTIGKDVVINLTGDGTVTAGKVADAPIQIAVGAPLVSDTASHYPGLDDTFTITNNTAYAIVEYK